MDVHGIINSSNSENINSIVNSSIIGGFSIEALIIGFIISSIGMIYFRYGKKNDNYISILCGIGLMGFPYFTDNIKYMILISLILGIIPFIINF